MLAAVVLTSETQHAYLLGPQPAGSSVVRRAKRAAATEGAEGLRSNLGVPASGDWGPETAAVDR
jgi:hypothetical protein